MKRNDKKMREKDKIKNAWVVRKRDRRGEEGRGKDENTREEKAGEVKGACRRHRKM